MNKKSDNFMLYAIAGVILMITGVITVENGETDSFFEVLGVIFFITGLLSLILSIIKFSAFYLHYRLRKRRTKSVYQIVKVAAGESSYYRIRRIYKGTVYWLTSSSKYRYEVECDDPDIDLWSKDERAACKLYGYDYADQLYRHIMKVEKLDGPENRSYEVMLSSDQDESNPANVSDLRMKLVSKMIEAKAEGNDEEYLELENQLIKLENINS